MADEQKEQFKLDGEAASKWLSIALGSFLKEREHDTSDNLVIAQAHFRFLVELVARLAMNGVEPEAILSATNFALNMGTEMRQKAAEAPAS